MSLNRKQPIRAVFPRKSQKKVETAQTDLPSLLSYALLILYVLASVSSTKDSMLLMPSKGIQLPLVSVTVSVVGFYFLSPLIVLAGHLVTLRRLPKMFAGLNAPPPKASAELLSRHTDIVMLMGLLSAGPATLFYILSKFTAYQSPLLFIIQVVSLYCACYASRIRSQELLALHLGERVKKMSRRVRRAVAILVELWLLLCIDVIFLPTFMSPTFYLKTHTRLLDNVDGGTVAWVPHIEIDRSERLWSGPTKTDSELAAYSGHADPKDYFMTREVALDIRSRNLRFLDISMQILPRVWAQNADLAGANLSFARLYGSVFVDTNLNGATFDMTSLDGTMFMNIDLALTNFNHTAFKGSYWNDVTVKKGGFYNSDFSLASFFNVSFDHVEFIDTSLQASSLFEVKGNTMTFFTPEPYKVMSVSESENWMKHSASIFEVDPQAAFERVQQYLCKPELSPDWAYAWGMFMQTKTLVASKEPDIVKALQDFLKIKGCEGLPDRGLAADAAGFYPAQAKEKAVKHAGKESKVSLDTTQPARPPLKSNEIP